MGKQLYLVPTPEEQLYFIACSEEFAKNAEKMRKGNKSAGRRFRVQTDKIRNLAKQAKKESILIRDRNEKRK
jgi:hypothetical protein